MVAADDAPEERDGEGGAGSSAEENAKRPSSATLIVQSTPQPVVPSLTVSDTVLGELDPPL